MICERCGKENQESANFCQYCGNPLPPDLYALVQRAKRNDQSALAEIYQYSSPEVYRVIRILIRDQYTADDILQDTYIKAFTRLNQLQNPNSLVPWLKMIANNTAKDWLKKSKPMVFSDLSAGKTSDVLPFEERIEYENIELNPEVEIDEKEVRRLVMEILDQLPEDQRMVIGMFYYEEMSVKAIADILGISENTVKSRLSYGRKKVKEQVLELEKRGTRLYTVAPFVFFLYLLRRMQGTSLDYAEISALQRIMESGISPAVKSSASIKNQTVNNQTVPDTARMAGRRTSTVSKAAATASGTAAKHIGVKIAAIILAGSVGAGGIVYGVIKNADKLPFGESHMTVIHKDEEEEPDMDLNEDEEEFTESEENEMEVEVTPEVTAMAQGEESGYYTTVLNPNSQNGQGKYYLGRITAVEHTDDSITFYGSFSKTDELPFTYSAEDYLEDGTRTFLLTPETQYYFGELEGNQPTTKEHAIATCERLNGLGVTLKVTDGKVETMTFYS